MTKNDPLLLSYVLVLILKINVPSDKSSQCYQRQFNFKREFLRTRSIERLAYMFYLKISRFSLFNVSLGVKAIVKLTKYANTTWS